MDILLFASYVLTWRLSGDYVVFGWWWIICLATVFFGFYSFGLDMNSGFCRRAALLFGVVELHIWSGFLLMQFYFGLSPAFSSGTVCAVFAGLRNLGLIWVYVAYYEFIIWCIFDVSLLGDNLLWLGSSLGRLVSIWDEFIIWEWANFCMGLRFRVAQLFTWDVLFFGRLGLVFSQLVRFQLGALWVLVIFWSRAGLMGCVLPQAFYIL